MSRSMEIDPAVPNPPSGDVPDSVIVRLSAEYDFVHCIRIATADVAIDIEMLTVFCGVL